MRFLSKQNSVLVITEMLRFDHIIMHILLYVHSNISAICLEVLNIYVSYSLPYIEKIILSTSECSKGYSPRTEMVIISELSSCHQLGLVRIPGFYDPSPMSYARRCLTFFSAILSHTLKKH